MAKRKLDGKAETSADERAAEARAKIRTAEDRLHAAQATLGAAWEEVRQVERTLRDLQDRLVAWREWAAANGRREWKLADADESSLDEDARAAIDAECAARQRLCELGEFEPYRAPDPELVTGATS